MTKLTTERLEYYAALPTKPAERKAIFMYEVRCMARQLLAYEQAAKNPVAYRNKFTGQFFTLEQQPDAVTDTAVYEPVFLAAPLLPKQPELLSIGELLHRLEEQTGEKWVEESAQPAIPEQPELVESLKKVMKSWLAMEPKLAYQPEFTDVMMLLDAEPAIQLAPHVYRDLVNDLRDVALEYHGAQQLRERIRGALSKAVTATHPHIVQPAVINNDDDDLIQRLSGRAKFLRDKGEVKTPQLIEAAISALSAQPVSEPVAWRCDREETRGVVITVHKTVAESWRLKGWKVTSLIEATPAQEQK